LECDLLLLHRHRGARLCSRQLLIDDLNKLLDRLRTVEKSSVDEECRCACDAQTFRFINIELHGIMVRVLKHAPIEPFHIQTHHGRETFQIIVRCFWSLRKEQIVIFPKLALVRGTARRFGSRSSAWMENVERKVPIDQPDTAIVPGHHLLYYRFGSL